jgi:hypothetical protein
MEREWRKSEKLRNPRNHARTGASACAAPIAAQQIEQVHDLEELKLRCSKKSSLLKPDCGQNRSPDMMISLRVRMLRLSAVLLLMLLALPAAAQQGRDDYPSIVPRDWTLLPPKNNEWRAVSPGRDAWLSLYITPAEGSISSHLRQWGVGAGDRVTYERQGQGWTVVSGYTADDRIFYRKTMLACEGHKWHNLAFEYPASDKRAMDEFVTRASYALAAYNRAGC